VIFFNDQLAKNSLLEWFEIPWLCCFCVNCCFFFRFINLLTFSQAFVTFALASLAMALAMPYPMPYPYPMPDDPYAPPPSYNAPIGRVKIQAYRGPSKGDGYDNFAPWGFYVTQPKDNFNGYHH